MKETMFCFQCPETAQSKGCTAMGMCKKKSSTAALMDGLLFVCRGIGAKSITLGADVSGISVARCEGRSWRKSLASKQFDDVRIERTLYIHHFK